jgi:hypothetical protein
MADHESTPTADGDRYRLPMSFDAERMAQDVSALQLGTFVEYDVMPLRAPAHIVDPAIPPPPPTADYADGSWTDWLDTAALVASPYLSQVIDTFRAKTRVTLVRLLRLAAGGVVKEHCDPTLGLHIESSVIRLTVPVLVNDDVEFYLNGRLVPMRPGECWYLRLTDPHRIVNAGSTERINLSIDMQPNAWVRSILAERSQGG